MHTWLKAHKRDAGRVYAMCDNKKRMPTRTKTGENIALTGLMGSGKSSVGRTLARLLRRKFVDTDALIEEREGLSITDIFSQKGEAYFRDLEKLILADVCKEKAQVISLGGGTIVPDDNREYLRKYSKLVALVANPEELYKRVKRRKARPLLNESEDPLETLKQLWEKRKKAYLDSDLQVETEGKDVEEIAREIVDTLSLKKSATYKLKVSIPEKPIRYSIIFDSLNNFDPTLMPIGGKIMVVSQKPIAQHYLADLEAKLATNFKLVTLVLDDGEDTKNFFAYQHILQKLLDNKFERNDSILALGGGVVGDLVGFAASTYFRGINYIQVPTTLLAMIDSSVGGKTAINVPQGKNLIGTFYQPRLVYIDVTNLNTLPDKEYRSGLGELVKYTLLGAKWDELLGESFFNFVSRHAAEIRQKDPEILVEVIEHCLKIKSNIVAQDEKEQGIRAHLNLGHTFAHGIEELTQYHRYSHGEAVTMGLVCACHLGEGLGIFKSGYTKKILDLMDELGLNYKIPADLKTKDIIKSCAYDKKSENGKLKFIVPKGQIGNVAIVHDIDLQLIGDAIDANR